MYMLTYTVSCKPEEFWKCFKHRCEKLDFQSDFLEGDSLYVYTYIEGCLIKKQTQYTNLLLCFFICITSYLDIFWLWFPFVCWFHTDFHFNSLSLKLLFLCFSEWSLFLLHNENVICVCEHLLYPLFVKDFCYYVWRKGFHFSFLFRDIFWRAECEASLILKGHAQKQESWLGRVWKIW